MLTSANCQVKAEYSFNAKQLVHQKINSKDETQLLELVFF